MQIVLVLHHNWSLAKDSPSPCRRNYPQNSLTPFTNEHLLKMVCSSHKLRRETEVHMAILAILDVLATNLLMSWFDRASHFNTPKMSLSHPGYRPVWRHRSMFALWCRCRFVLKNFLFYGLSIVSRSGSCRAFAHFPHPLDLFILLSCTSSSLIYLLLYCFYICYYIFVPILLVPFWLHNYNEHAGFHFKWE